MWVAVLVSNFSVIQPSLRLEVEGRSRVIEDMFNRFLAADKIKVKGIRKVTITLTPAPGNNVIWDPLKNYSPVINVQRIFKFEQYSVMSPVARNNYILAEIEESFEMIRQKYPINGFREIGERIRKIGFVNRFLVGRLKISSDKKLRAGVEVDFRNDQAVLSIVFFESSNNLVQRVDVIAVHPNRLFITPLIGKSTWTSNSHFEFSSKSGEIHFVASVKEQNGSIYFTPKVNSEDKLIDELIIASVESRKDLVIDLLRNDIKGALS